MNKNIKKQLLTGKNMNKDKVSKIIGVIAICINILFICDALYLFYSYNFTDKLYAFMYPNWVLLVNALFGIVGGAMSIVLYKNRIGIKLFLIVTFLLWFNILSNYGFPF